MNKVELAFSKKAAIDRGTWFLLRKDDAVDFIVECQKASIEILGIDGFYKIDEVTIQPSMEHSIDYSLEPTQNVHEKAIKFLKAMPDNLFFEIVCAQ